MSFIQVQQSLVTHRKTLRLARLLGMDRYAVIGRLVALWTWSLDNALESGCLGEGIEADILAEVMDWDGPPDELVDALIDVGFLDFARDARGTRHLHLHDWQVWASQTTPNGDHCETTNSSDEDDGFVEADEADEEEGEV